MSKNLSLSMVRGCASVLLNSSTSQIIDAIGVTNDEWDLLVADRPWIGTDRAKVTRILDSILFGMIDTMGLPRFELPAEYVATLITIFVSPVNYFSACSWMGSFVRGSDLAGYMNREEPVEGFEKVKPSQIFALCCDIRTGSVVRPYTQEFERKVNLKLALIEED